MLGMLRQLRGVIPAFVLAAGIGGGAIAAPVVSGSGNLQFEILSADYANGLVQGVEAVAVGQNAFRIQAVGGGPLVPNGENLSLQAVVTALQGTDFAQWTGQLIGTTSGSMGESVEDLIGNGLGVILVNAATPNGSVTFAPLTALFLTKDINGLDGPIEAVIQGTEFVNTSTAVPEPLTLALFGTGLLGLAVARRRRAV